MPIQPMLAKPLGDRDWRKMMDSGSWVAETKLDGIRALISPNGEIYSRSGMSITGKFPEVSARWGRSNNWFDGEIVADSGVFEDVLFREAQSTGSRVARVIASHPCRFVAFDLPAAPGDWVGRRNRLVDIVGSQADITDLVHSSQIDGRKGEGVVFKRRAAVYQPGVRSDHWLKMKFVRRVSCIAYGYSQGSGSRAHFGALQLALLDGDSAVPVGRTGSGFAEWQIPTLKERLDRGEPFVVEIECLQTTASGVLRQPVFKGVRNDIGLDACTYDQLESP